MHENTVLNAISTSHPVKSSFAKLTKETGMARNEIIEVVTDLKEIGYINTTTANEIYLVADGRKFLGLDNDNSKAKSPGNSTEEIIAISGHRDIAADIETSSSASEEVISPESTVFKSIDELATKLSEPVFEINDLALKGQALTKLAALMSEDISDLLLEVKEDLERAAA